MGSLFLYAGLISTAVGLGRVVVSFNFLFLPYRLAGLVLGCSGIAVGAVGLLLPAPLLRSSRATNQLDRFIPEFQFEEFHQTIVEANDRAIDAAIRGVRSSDIHLFGVLTAIRNPGRLFRKQPEGILNPSLEMPILEAAKRSGFMVMADDPSREIVLGTYVVHPAGDRPPAARFVLVKEPGYAKAAINFRIEPLSDTQCRLTTETRVFATDPATARRFAVYWRLIYPGSSLIRTMWLRAIARRATAGLSPARSATR